MPEKRGARFKAARSKRSDSGLPLPVRLHRLIYEFHELGCIEQAMPFIVPLMKLAKAVEDDRCAISVLSDF